MALKSRLPLWAWKVIAIAVVAACDVLNFSDMMWGNGSLSSFIVSIAYVLIWAALVFINRSDRKFLRFFTVFSCICLTAGLLGLGITSNVITNGVLTTAAVIGVLFLTPLYGFRFVIAGNSFPLLYTVYIVMFVVCAVAGFLLEKKAK